MSANQLESNWCRGNSPGKMDDNDDFESSKAEAFAHLLNQLYPSVPENTKQAFANKAATEAKKLAQSVGTVPRPVVEAASQSSTAVMISSGAVANTKGNSVEMLKRGKHMMCLRVILLVRRRP